VEGFVGHGHVAGIGVSFGIDGHAANAHAVGGLDDPAGDFAPVGNENFAEH